MLLFLIIKSPFLKSLFNRLIKKLKFFWLRLKFAFSKIKSLISNFFTEKRFSSDMKIFNLFIFEISVCLSFKIILYKLSLHL